METAPQPADANLRDVLGMQEALAARFFGFSSDETLMQWIERYSAKFRELIRRDPALLERFATKPEAALGEAEAALHAAERREA